MTQPQPQQLAPGVGWLARRPRRLYLRAYSAADLTAGQASGNPTEQVSTALIKATLSYGALGTCQGGTLDIVDAPPGWSGLYSRLILLDLESEHGTHTVFRALLRSVKRSGRNCTCELVGLHALLDGAVGGGGVEDSNNDSPLLLWPLITARAQFGVNLDYPRSLPANTPQPRGERIRRALEAYPEADWGVTASGVGVAGLPASATRHPLSRAALGAQYGEVTDQGYTEPPYATDAVVTWPEGFGATYMARTANEVPLFTPRRATSTSADPQTLTVQQSVPVQGGHVPNAAVPLDGTAVPFSASGTVDQPGITLPQRTGSRRPKTLRVSVPMVVTQADAGSSLSFALSVSPVPASLGAGRTEIITLTTANTNVVVNRVFEFSRDLLEQMTGLFITSQPREKTGSGTVQVGPITAVADVEIINEGAVATPDGWGMPFQAGPTFEGVLNGCWLIPPAQVEELAQDVAGVVVTWEAHEARSRYLTAALPYPGQTRGGR